MANQVDVRVYHLARLIRRLYGYQDGEPTVDGRDIRRQIGLVPQESFIFSGSVRDNIRCGQPQPG